MLAPFLANLGFDLVFMKNDEDIAECHAQIIKINYKLVVSLVHVLSSKSTLNPRGYTATKLEVQARSEHTLIG